MNNLHHLHFLRTSNFTSLMLTNLPNWMTVVYTIKIERTSQEFQLAVQVCQQLFIDIVNLALSMRILASVYFSLHIFTGNKGCEYQS